jgi:hypothetical protein
VCVCVRACARARVSLSTSFARISVVCHSVNVKDQSLYSYRTDDKSLCLLYLFGL